MTDQTPATSSTPSKPIWVRWWMIVIYIVVGLGALGSLVGDDNTGNEDSVAGAATTTTAANAPEPIKPPPAAATTAGPTTTTLPPTTTTTLPATTTTSLPIISEGVYVVPDEVAHGVYRHTSYMARLDADLEIIDNDLVIGDGFGLMVILEGDSYADIGGEAILYEELGPVDPIVLGFTDGRYVVGYDIQPGRYRISAEGDDFAYWARLDDTLDIIDNDLGEGQLIVIVKESDFALEISGTIEPLP